MIDMNEKGEVMKVRKNGAVTYGLIITAFIAAALVYALLIYTEKKVTASEETFKVYCAKVDIPAGTKINAVNYAQYFEEKEIVASLVPEGSIGDYYALTEKTTIIEISKGTILAGGMFRQSDFGSIGMKEPVLLGLKADDIFQVAGGILRSGDWVHIYILDENEEAVLRWKNVCIENAFDGSGNELTAADAGKATRFNIYMEMNDVEEFYTLLDSGRIRIVKQ